jgi:hypothetical protein
MGLAFISGLQGDDPKYLKVVATPKHFAVHSGPEQLRHEFDVKPRPGTCRRGTYPRRAAAVVNGAIRRHETIPLLCRNVRTKRTMRTKSPRMRWRGGRNG